MIPLPVLTLLKSRWLHYGLLALACALLWLRGSHYQNERNAARLAAREQVAEYRRVYGETFRKHFAAKQAEDARLQNNKTEADNATLPARTAALGSAAAYRDAHRCVRAAAADPGSAGGAGVPAPAAGPRGAEAGAPPADMVAITVADHDACTLNTADLGIAVEWARKLPQSILPEGER